MMKNNRNDGNNGKNEIYKILKESSFSVEKAIDTIASEIGKSKFISLRDACTCTGNCGDAGDYIY